MTRALLFLSGGIVGVFALGIYGQVQRGDGILPIAAMFALIVALPNGLWATLPLKAELGKANMRLVVVLYWLSALIFFASATMLGM